MPSGPASPSGYNGREQPPTTANEEDPALPGDPVDEYARLISGLVHDLRAPLASVIGAASSLAAHGDRFDGDTRARLLKSIEQEAERLDRMLADLSLVARGRSGTLAPERRAMRLHDVLVATVHKARLQHAAPRPKIAPDLPEITLELDPGLVQAALLNLLDLATTFAADGVQPLLTVGMQGSNCAALVCSAEVDAGKRDALRDVLTAFAQGGRASRARLRDLISLEAAREVVHSHGGKLTVENAPENEMKLVVSLPIRSAAATPMRERGDE